MDPHKLAVLESGPKRTCEIGSGTGFLCNINIEERELKVRVLITNKHKLLEEEFEIRGKILRDRIKFIEYSLSTTNLNKYKEIMEEIETYPIEFFNRFPFIRESFMCLYEYFSSFQTFDDYLLIHKLFHSWVVLYKYIANSQLLKRKLRLSDRMNENIDKFEMLLKDIDKMSTRKYKTYKNQKSDARYKITHRRAKYCNFPYLGKLTEESEKDVIEFDGQTHRPTSYNLNILFFGYIFLR